MHKKNSNENTLLCAEPKVSPVYQLLCLWGEMNSQAALQVSWSLMQTVPPPADKVTALVALYSKTTKKKKTWLVVTYSDILK